MIIEKPYDQLKAVKSKMRNMARNLAELEIIVDNMQDYIMYNLEGKAANLEYELNKRDRSEEFNKILHGFGKEK